MVIYIITLFWIRRTIIDVVLTSLPIAFIWPLSTDSPTCNVVYFYSLDGERHSRLKATDFGSWRAAALRYILDCRTSRPETVTDRPASTSEPAPASPPSRRVQLTPGHQRLSVLSASRRRMSDTASISLPLSISGLCIIEIKLNTWLLMCLGSS